MAPEHLGEDVPSYNDEGVSVKHSRWIAAVAAIVVTAGFVGCAPGGESSGTTDDSDQTLKLAVAAPPTTFAIGAWSGGDATLFTAVFDTLVQFDNDGEIVPGMAKSWEYSEDLTQLTFEIREGMTFSDGEPADAAAIVASLEAARVGPSTSQNLSVIESIEAPDETTVAIKLSAPSAGLLPSLAETPGAVSSPKQLGSEAAQLEPVGSGPYVLDEDRTTAGSKYVLERNPEYWDADSYPFETVEVSVIADPTAVQNALLSGQLDFGTLQSDDATSQFNESQFTTGVGEPAALLSLWFADPEGAIVPALADERVRKAINLAIDRESIAKAFGETTMTPTNQIFSVEGDVFSPELLKETPYDLDEARSLMADAGYENGFEVTMPSTVVSTQFEPSITQALGDIGITVTWQSVPFQEFYAKVFGGNYGIFYMANGVSPGPLMLTTSTNGIFNPTGYTTPEYQELLADVNSAPLEDQTPALQAINEYFVDSSWFAPIAMTATIYAHSNDITYDPPVRYGTSLKPFAPAD